MGKAKCAMGSSCCSGKQNVEVKGMVCGAEKSKLENNCYKKLWQRKKDDDITVEEIYILAEDAKCRAKRANGRKMYHANKRARMTDEEKEEFRVQDRVYQRGRMAKMKDEALTAREKKENGESLTLAEEIRLTQFETYQANKRRNNEGYAHRMARARHLIENPLEERSPEEEALVEHYIERLDRASLMHQALVKGESLLVIIFIFESNMYKYSSYYCFYHHDRY